MTDEEKVAEAPPMMFVHAEPAAATGGASGEDNTEDGE